MKADPKTVDLRSQAQHFYNLAVKIMELFEGEEMVEVLTEVGLPHACDQVLGFN